MAKLDPTDRSHKNRQLEDHILGETEVVENSQEEKDINWEAKQGVVESSTKLEDDTGHGDAIVVRSFDYKANPEAFRLHTPSKQELFNAHIKQIEVHLWTDGLKVMTDVSPKVMLSKKKDGYRIVVGAEPMRGQSFSLRDKPQTLSEIAHG